MLRFSLLDTPHKGLRYALAELSLLAGNSDYTSIDQIRMLQDKAASVFRFLEEHAEVEDKYVLPALESRIPDSTKHDMDDHVRLHRLQEQIEKGLAELPRLAQHPELAVKYGKELYQDISRLHADHLEHMLEEEKGTQQLMWLSFTDEEMMGIYRKVVSGFSFTSLMNSLQYILPAQNHKERSAMLKGIKAGAPAEALEKVLELAEKVLDEFAFELLHKELFSRV